MAAPMLDDMELKAVQWIRQETEQDFVRQKIVGLDGTLHQKLGRRSHRVMLSGVLLPETAADDLKKLQEKAAAGAEVTFTADITTALSVTKMVIERFAAEEQVGAAEQIGYTLVLAEDPPLPPPAEVSSFGGLDDFGLGDLGFDPGALGDVLDTIEEQAGAIMETVDAALDVVNQVQALASLGDLLSVGNPIKPVVDKVGELNQLGPAIQTLSGLLGGPTS